MSDDPSPSLFGRLARHGHAARLWLWLAIGAVLATTVLIGTVAAIRAARIESATRQLISRAPAPAAGEAEARAVADAFAQPRLATTLAGLSTNLPADTLLAEAARGRDGSLRILIDTADPDAVRPLLAANPWLANFHERAQEVRPEGRIRVTLVEGAR